MAKATKRLPAAPPADKLKLTMTDEGRELAREYARLERMFSRWSRLTARKAGQDLRARYERDNAAFRQRASEIAQRIAGPRGALPVPTHDLATLALIEMVRADKTGVAGSGLHKTILAATGAVHIRRGHIRLA
jgi:hypothetical protein